jgi:hypothetical protein
MHWLAELHDRLGAEPVLLAHAGSFCIYEIETREHGFATVTAGISPNGSELIIFTPLREAWPADLMREFADDFVELPPKDGDASDLFPSGLTELLYVRSRLPALEGAGTPLLLGIGVTAPEGRIAKSHGTDILVKLLVEDAVFPQTPSKRRSLANLRSRADLALPICPFCGSGFAPKMTTCPVCGRSPDEPPDATY